MVRVHRASRRASRPKGTDRPLFGRASRSASPGPPCASLPGTGYGVWVDDEIRRGRRETPAEAEVVPMWWWAPYLPPIHKCSSRRNLDRPIPPGGPRRSRGLLASDSSRLVGSSVDTILWPLPNCALFIIISERHKSSRQFIAFQFLTLMPSP